MKLIVMVCNLKENERVQCDQYWPKKNGEMVVYEKESEEGV